MIEHDVVCESDVRGFYWCGCAERALAQAELRIEAFEQEAAGGTGMIEREIKAERGHQACPCIHVEPCDPRCTCRDRFSSYGCIRCCSYGSVEQQRVKAHALADHDARLARLEEILRALYEAEGHSQSCGFSKCTCGAVERRTEARTAAAGALRSVAGRQAEAGKESK